MNNKGIAELPQVTITPEDMRLGRLPSVLAQAAEQYGPILKYIPAHYKYKGDGFVFMVGAEANRFVLHTHRHLFSHDKGWTPIIGESFGKGLLNMDDPQHALHRKLWNPAFSRAFLATYIPIMQRVIAQRIETWPEDGVLNVYDEARQITFEVTAVALAGFESGAELDEMRNLFYTMLHTFNKRKESWGQFRKRRKRAGQKLNARLLHLIEARRRQTQQPGDVLGMIVHACDETGLTLSNQEILSHLHILLIAGHETTTTLSAWTLYLLATQPEERQPVLAEVDSLLSDKEAISLATTQEMTRLDYFIRETGRLYPPVVNVPRGVLHPFEFDGYTISANRRIRLALAACHRLPHLFANPNAFDPSRFGPPRSEDKRTRYALVTFGAGSRICIGVNFAQIEVKLLVAHLLQRYHFAPIAEETPIHRGYWIARTPGGVQLRVVKRG